MERRVDHFIYANPALIFEIVEIPLEILRILPRFWRILWQLIFPTCHRDCDL